MSFGQGLASKYSSGFNPLDIGGCALWLDAADTSKFTMSGSNMATWTDKSSNAYSCTPVSGNSITRSTQNGLNTFFFNVTRATIPNFVWTNDSTVFMVTNAVTVGFLYSQWTTTYTNYCFAGNNYLFYVGSAIGYNDNSNAAGKSPQPLSSWGIFSLGYDSTAKAVTNYAVNGTTRSTIVMTGTAPGAASTTASLFLNGNGTTASESVYVGEILHYNRSLSTAERQQVEAYLAGKWGIQSFLQQLTYSSNVPLSIPGCALWLDAADSSTITLSNGNVTQWNDKSGSNQHAIQTVAGKYPTYSNAAVNGLSAVQTSSTGTTMYVPSFRVTLPVTVILVSKTTGTGGLGSAFIEMGADITANPGFYIFPKNNWFFGLRTASAYQAFYDSTTGANIAGFNAVGTTYVYIANITPTLRINNTQVATTFGSNTGSATGSLTSQLNIGSRNQSGAYGDVQYCEILVYNGTLTGAQHYPIWRYLTQKWGIVPITPHPYASILPVTRRFEPIDITGCVLWLDAADSSTLTLSGSNATQWRDKSSNAFAGTVVGSPPYTSNAINNLPGITFNGSSQYVDFGNILNLGTAPIYVFIVCKFDSTANGGVVSKSSARGLTGRWFMYRDTGSLYWGTDVANVATNTIFSDSSTAVRLLEGFWDRSTLLFLENATQRATASLVNSTSLSTTDPLYIAAYPNSNGTAPLAGYYMAGRVGEVIIYNQTLTTAQQQQVEGYLAWKWGLRSSFPSTQPFRNQPPAIASFNPRQISNCSLWLDAADQSTLTLSGCNVTQWNDKVSGVVFTTQGPTSNIVLSNSINGYPGIYFNNTASDSVYMSGTFSNILTGTAFYVFKAATQRVTDFRPFLNWFSGGTFPTYGYVGAGAAANTVGPYTAFGGVGTPTQVLTAGSNYVISYGWSGTSTAVTTNGSTVATGTQPAYSSSTTTCWIGADGAGATGRTTLTYGELILFNRRLTSVERQLVEGYLAKKWGLQVPLPSTHPYKKISPI